MDINIFSAFLFSLMAASAFSKISVNPIDYELDIITQERDFKDTNESVKLTFKGTVIINFNVSRSTSEEPFQVALNTHADTKIESVTLKGNTTDIIKDISQSVEKEKLIIKSNSSLSEYTSFQLTVRFENPYGNDMTGFYRSSYKDGTGKTRWLLTTHFEPIYARKAFPCFDQPDLKAFFKIKLTVPKTITNVLCNTPAKKTTAEENNVYTCEKHKTPMSTYLVAFTASEFASTKEETFESNYPEGYGNLREIRTHGRKEIIEKGEAKLAQVAGKEALNGLTKYLGIGYALEKVDQVGIPDFSAGAMENWGHVSFREKALFYNETTGSTTTKQSNVLTITHELVHQWFGNLVTLKTWDYIWLNEAFANYLEYVIADKFRNNDLNTNEWKLLDQLVVNEIHFRAFETDGLKSSKPLNNNITDEKLIDENFNDIPYAKGASVLRMWNRVLTEEKFQNSLKSYIDEKKGGAALPEDLYKHFKTNGMEPAFFDTWTKQAGYPVVEVKKINKNTYTLTQSRFFWEKLPSEGLWYIPISYSTDSSPKFDDKFTYMEAKELNITAEGNWIIVNNQQTGYYRVNYDEENWKALASALSKNSSAFTELNRAQIVNDIFSLARSLQKKYVGYSTALDLASYLSKEKSQIVLKTALNAFDFLQTKLFNTEIEDKFKEYIRGLIVPHFKSLESKTLSHTEKLKNIDISRWACALEDKSCVQQALDYIKNDTYSKLPDTQGTILCTGIRKREDLWDIIFEKYEKEEDSSLKLVYLTALGCTEIRKKTEKFLNMTLNPQSGIRKQDLVSVVSAVYNGNLKNVEVAFKFVEENYKKIAEYGGLNPLGKVLVGIAKKLNRKEDFERLKNLSEKIKKEDKLKGSEGSVANALQIAESNYIWMNEKESQFRTYFKGSGSIVSYSLTLLSLSLAFVFNF